MGYNFGCMIASDTLFDSRGGFFGVKLSDVTDFEVLRDVAMATIFWAFYIWGAHWRNLANTTEPSMCGGDVALCHITLATCYGRPVYQMLTLYFCPVVSSIFLSFFLA